jgi:hypothetical protein
MNRRRMITVTGLGLGAMAVGGFGPCGVTKGKAVRYVQLTIDLCKDAAPLLVLLSSQDIADLVLTKVVPALEKLKDALSSTDIPTADNLFQTVQGALGAVATALLNLPESARRTTILGIIASVNILLRTVSAFIESETDAATTAVKPSARTSRAVRVAASPNAIKAAFEASRF